jgi:hypothetical protein
MQDLAPNLGRSRCKESMLIDLRQPYTLTNHEISALRREEVGKEIILAHREERERQNENSGGSGRIQLTRD